MSAPENLPRFDELGLDPRLVRAIQDIGYESPSPIQAACIPPLLAGRDLLGQAQTGTGKTAAFALPLLSRLDLDTTRPQLLVLAPTRELAIQVAEAFQSYARYLPGFHVLPIYGGQAYSQQLRPLKRGVHVVVGTPGRVMDHIRRGTLQLDALRSLVLDEADEMLRMGFIDDVEWILEHTPEGRQIALFSATMPDVIRKVARRHLSRPEEIRIASKTTTADTIHQRYWQVSGVHKLDALTRILESEDFDAVLVFVRTKTATVELAEKLAARGHACEALNGDIPQQQREKIVDRLKRGKLDILVATDVVARGLDVERISHVINYDIPYDVESYTHRIGRTGRAGRKGDAILFVSPRERRLLRTFERHTRQAIEPMQLPSTSEINIKRMERFKQRITDTLASEDLDLYLGLVTDYQQEHDTDPLRIAAALARLSQGDAPLLLSERPARERKERPPRDEDRAPRERKHARKPPPAVDALPLGDYPDIPMERFRVDVGYQHGVKPGNLVGAIANEAEIESRYIGHIEIHDDFTTVDLPEGMPPEVMKILKKTWVCGQRLNLRRYDGDASAPTHKSAKTRKHSANKGARKRKKPKKAAH